MKIKIKSILLLSCLILVVNSSKAYTGEVIRSFSYTGSYPTGLAYDGKNIWVSDRVDKKLYCINPENGKVIRSLPSPAYWPMGLTWDGTALWCSDFKGGLPLHENYGGMVYKVDPANGDLLQTVNVSANKLRGIAWDGKYLWCVDNQARKIVQFNSEDGTEIITLTAPASEPFGLCYDGKYLWSTDRAADEIYMMDPATGSVIIVTDAPGPCTSGLCFDGKYIWAVDFKTKKLYQLKVNDGEKFRKYNEHKSKLTYTHQTTNFGPGKVKTLDVHFALPTDRDNQQVNGDIAYSPKYTDIVTDKWGQKTAHFHFDNIPPLENKTVHISMTATTWDVRYFIFPENVGKLSDIPQEVKTKFLVDDEKYNYNHPVIQKALKEAIGNETNVYWMARKIYIYVIEHLYYEMAGGWNTAPTVLARGNGSCSEYTFVFLSMCRAAGIPARYVGSVYDGDEAYYDDTFHRWSEIYLPNYGWIPVDPTNGDNPSPRIRAERFGFVEWDYFITTQGGGGSETMGWTYNSNEFYTTEPKTNVTVDFYGDWESLSDPNAISSGSKNVCK